MFNSSTKLISFEDQNENVNELESEIANIMNGESILELPYIEEICPACGKKKKIGRNPLF